jgi:hypothetical protein
MVIWRVLVVCGFIMPSFTTDLMDWAGLCHYCHYQMQVCLYMRRYSSIHRAPGTCAYVQQSLTRV